MFTAEDAAAKVIQAREAAQIKEEEKRNILGLNMWRILEEVKKG